MAAPVRVLIVDDQEPFRLAAAEVVGATESFVVVGMEATGEGCLAAVPVLRPDLVLMDVNLPGIDGIEAARQLTSSADAPAVVLVSSYDEDTFGGQLAGCGAVAYISKSVFGSEGLAAVWALATGIAARTSDGPPGAPLTTT
ncbi:response regulator [Pseudonocardia broussonetiae]|uniref:Response regulator transcription factor n=1 Tax=Pseudonocardia broussonetiae TaxID=2736640 RepID=A0A6M6JPB5_9PSEU|nr:response regulator transcription factor [Pseudonocardia broussonetiae]QJY49030.1 response regulator transcription factor [Pseudonocardia broussonetiae]